MNETTKNFIKSVIDSLDDDLVKVLNEHDVKTEVILLLQILREIRRKPDEEKSPPVRGFGI